MKQNEIKGMDLEKVALRVLQTFPHFEAVMKRTPVVDTGGGTPGGVAATDGGKIYFNPSAMGDEKQQAAIWAHELFHIVEGDCDGHMTELKNIAYDAVNNEKQAQSGLALDDGFVDIPGAQSIGKTRLYEILLKLEIFLKEDEINQGQQSEANPRPEEKLTKQELHLAIFGYHSLWHKAMRWLDYKENQTIQKKTTLKSGFPIQQKTPEPVLSV